jgi:hypothetical protein
VATEIYLTGERQDVRRECIDCPEAKFCADKLESFCSLELEIDARLDDSFRYGNGTPLTDCERAEVTKEVIVSWRMAAGERIRGRMREHQDNGKHNKYHKLEEQITDLGIE